MIAAIINVGTELLLGDTVNTNATYLGKLLAQLEIHTMRVETVGDNAERIAEAFERNRKTHDLIVFSGGLGPTVDDITKEIVCQSMGLELKPDAKAMNEIYKRIGKDIAMNNYKQTLFPDGATIMYNANGTAPGMYYDAGDYKVVLLPGPPSELVPMCENTLAPILQEISASTLSSRYLNVYGISESRLEERLEEILKKQKTVKIGTYFNGEKVTLRLTSSDPNRRKAYLDKYEAEIRKELSDMIITEDKVTIQEMLRDVLKKEGMKCVVAESCTGGMLAAKITSCSGASEIFDLGLTTYSNQQKIELLGVDKRMLESKGAVSKEVAAQMAKGAGLRANADISCSITGIAGPNSDGTKKEVGTVFISVWTKKYGSEVHEFHFKGSRDIVRKRSTNKAMVLLTKKAIDILQKI